MHCGAGDEVHNSCYAADNVTAQYLKEHGLQVLRLSLSLCFSASLWRAVSLCAFLSLSPLL